MIGMIYWHKWSLSFMWLDIVHIISLHLEWCMDRNPFYSLTMLFFIFMTVRFLLWLSWFKHIVTFRKVFKVSLKLTIGCWSSQPIDTTGMLSFLRVSMSMYLVSICFYHKAILVSLHQSGLVLSWLIKLYIYISCCLLCTLTTKVQGGPPSISCFLAETPYWSSSWY